SEMLDAPDREAAYEQKNRQKRQPREIGRRIAEIDGRAEHTPGDGRRNPDTEAAERGGKEHCRKIRGEKDVGPHQRKRPSRHGRQREAAGRKSNAEKRRW